MDKTDKELIDNYLNDSCSEEEAERVLQWFDSPEGQTWLQSNLNLDIARISQLDNGEQLRDLIPELDSEKVFQSIHAEIQHRSRERGGRGYVHHVAPLFKAAAAILVILTSSVLYQSHYNSIMDQQLTEPEPVHYVTADDQQKRITLSDGTTVRLNGNSELLVAHDYLRERREVSLTGEAFFEVAHNPDKPFVIQAGDASVEVLGTSFNVRALEESRDVQLAVTEGSVRFGYASEAEGRGDSGSVVLEKGQFAQLDYEKQIILVEDFGVENYLSWMKGRLVFNELSLDQVCTQLSRLYEIHCEFTDESLKELKLTADFSNDTLEKTLSVIALSLDLEYESHGDHIEWKAVGKRS